MTSYILVSMSKWQLQQAKAHFSEFLDAALKKGPQIVTRRGVEEAVLVPMEQWRRLQLESRPNIKDLLLSDTARFGEIAPRRGAWKHRMGVDFSSSEFK